MPPGQDAEARPGERRVEVHAQEQRGPVGGPREKAEPHYRYHHAVRIGKRIEPEGVSGAAHDPLRNREGAMPSQHAVAMLHHAVAIRVRPSAKSRG